MAAAIVNFDDLSISNEDPEIGTVKFYLKKWGDQSQQGITFEEIPSRSCEASDFESEENEAFYPININALANLES